MAVACLSSASRVLRRPGHLVCSVRGSALGGLHTLGNSIPWNPHSNLIGIKKGKKKKSTEVLRSLVTCSKSHSYLQR